MSEGGVDGLGEEGEHVALLFAERMDGGHDAFREAATAVALRAEALLAPEDECAQFALAVIVRRFDPGAIDEGPECLPMREDVGATAGHTRKAQVHALLEKALHARPKRHALAAKRRARERAIPNAVPLVEEHVTEKQKVLAQLGDLGRLVLRERYELAEQVSPADLPPLHGPESELRGAVADEDSADGREYIAQVGPS